MKSDRLFLLAPGFEDRGQRQYCPECAEIWGVLAYYPFIRDGLEISYETLAHPRSGLTALLGDGEWNCPTLILSPDSPDGPGLQRLGSERFIDNARDIGRYWASLYGTALPR